MGSISKLLRVVLLVGVCVLFYSLFYPLYVRYGDSVADESHEMIEGWGRYYDEAGKEERLEAEPLSGSRVRREAVEPTQEELNEYEAPLHQPLIYEPEGQYELVPIEDEEEFVEERRAESPSFEGFDPLRIERSFETIEFTEERSSRLPPDEAIEQLRLEAQERAQLEREKGQEEESETEASGQAKSIVPERPSVKDARYLNMGWKKFSSYKEGFTVWVPGELFYVASRDQQRTEVYQCDADGIYYGIQRRRLEEPLEGLGSAQLRPIMEEEFQRWRSEFASGIPGFKIVNKFFRKVGEQAQLDALMGADAGQVRLYIFTSQSYIFWMWTVYLHDNKERANHQMFVNGIEVLVP